MAERRLHGLQRVLGVNALSSTAYGNVGLLNAIQSWFGVPLLTPAVPPLT